MAQTAVVITGMGATTPLGGTVPELWDGMLALRSGVRSLRGEGFDALPVHIAATLAVEPESAMPPVQARRLDRSQQAAVIAAREAWADAGLPDVDGDRLAVVIGTGIGGVLTLLGQDDVLERSGPRRVSPRTVPMLMANAAAAQVSIEFGARAAACAPTSACASGAEALVQAARLIECGEADIVIAGGAEAAITPLTIAGFAQIGALSKDPGNPEAASRPFDVNRTGFVLGEGAGIVILERADHARARGARIRAVLAGYGVTADAFHITGTDPEGVGQIKAIRKALVKAGLAPADVQHVNAHATATTVGDVSEALAVREALGEHVAVTAPKGALGHLVGAAGAVEAILTALTLESGVIPATRNLEKLDPAIDIDVVTDAPRQARVEAAVSNSFGFGGHNVSLLLTRP
ncbi:beta-ketoacyl-[acyl-carrier-protein] synthase family protein [Sinomonas sp. ASV486]|uniref:beta-ketoacyl-[acyl-carrier-protein] synthase family protein n=1 Tax=Sinomonas sp. ASV486 TaxID=3051170 RepID=UPI0027DBDF8B|nr:beta-ketoacyl-[acyl-carrier-protein] synthase family protein [Sinomonas sp. ASV486]MDQ4489256.1 beta-ketoacyl-[acyl-carrier-protein] synthase family protein [Sinomonas sp. ASV486]